MVDSAEFGTEPDASFPVFIDTENNIVLKKVKDQPGLTAINFDLLKSKTFLEFDSTKRNYVEITENLEKEPKTI